VKVRGIVFEGDMVTWLVRFVLGTVVIGLLQVWGIIFAVGCWWVCSFYAWCKSSLRRLWGGHGNEDE
jgi:hypothetical protein